jgi:serine/threonine protein kinase
MSGGALEEALHDEMKELSWRTRVAIVLQIALGMEHLHMKHMMHRDLKSANVLLDENFKAKVCDFGLSRVVKPARCRVVHSPFTGVTRILPQAVEVEIRDVPVALSMAHISVSILDARGAMTKAAGSLLWMAPEVFRGDQNYTSRVDVYSFGIVLWELATRKVPWVDELSSEQTAFFMGINLALQTGRRSAIPASVLAENEHSAAVVAVMQRCWAGDPVDRPTFSEAARDLADWLRGSARRAAVTRKTSTMNELADE